MRYFLIADNTDTQKGLRLAGIGGVVVHEKEEALKAIEKAKADPSIGILIITERISKLCPEIVFELKLKSIRPLLVEIPDRHGTARDADSITKYIREAIGIKI